MRPLLCALAALLLAAAARADPVGYAADLPACGDPDAIQGAVLVIDVTTATARCAVLMAREHPQVLLVSRSAAVADRLASLAAGQVLLVGPAFTARGVAEHLEMVARALAREVAADGDEPNAMRIPPAEALPAAARRYGWRRL